MAAMLRVRTVWQGVAGAPYYSNMYFQSTGTVGEPQDAVNAVDTFWEAIKGNIVNEASWTVEGFVPIIGDADGVLEGAYTVTEASGSGTSTDDMLPRQVQGLVQWETGIVLARRFLRGRTFIPALGESLNGPGGAPLAGLITLVTTAAQSLIVDTGNQLRVWSRTHGVSHEVTNATMDTQWATLNSRRD